MNERDINFQKQANHALNIVSVKRIFYCLKCKEEVIYIDKDIDIMERAEENDGVFCSNECEYSFYNGGDGSDY